jgi:hypothetical protein
MALVFCLFFVAGEFSGRKAHCSSTNKKDRTAAETAPERMAVDFAKMPLYFIANEGQVDEQAKVNKWSGSVEYSWRMCHAGFMHVSFFHHPMR